MLPGTIAPECPAVGLLALVLPKPMIQEIPHMVNEGLTADGQCHARAASTGKDGGNRTYSFGRRGYRYSTA